MWWWGGKQQKFCPHLLKERRSSVAQPLELERRSEAGGREGAEGRPFTAHLRRCFYRVHQCLNVCETASCVLGAFYLRYAVQLLWYSHRNEEQLTNSLLLPRGFSPAGSWALFSLRTAATNAALLPRSPGAAGAPLARPHLGSGLSMGDWRAA